MLGRSRGLGRGRASREELSFVTVVTYGRTGSTAIQSAMNSLPGVLVRGENYAALRGLKAYLQSVAETADRHHAGKPDHPWYGSARTDPGAILRDLRRHVVEFVLRPNSDTRVIGFKEIRYEPGHFATYDDLLDYLIFLGKLFPGLGYLMIVRDAQDAAKSGWWPGNDSAVDVLATTRSWLAQAVADLNAFYDDQRAVLVAYEDWTADPDVLVNAFDDLGLPSDAASVRASLGHRLDPGPHAGTE